MRMGAKSWILGALLMILMAVAVVVLITAGSRWLLTDRPAPHAPAQSGPLPKVLADEMKRNEQVQYLHGMNDAVEFWRLTGVVPDTPILQDALWARHQASPDPLTPSEAHTILQHGTPQAKP
jgi:hypothetical protein